MAGFYYVYLLVSLSHPECHYTGWTEDLEERPELILHLFLPLGCQTSRCEDERAARLAALGKSLPDHSRLNRFPEAYFIGQ